MVTDPTAIAVLTGILAVLRFAMVALGTAAGVMIATVFNIMWEHHQIDTAKATALRLTGRVLLPLPLMA